jgi:hypothetical protein
MRWLDSGRGHTGCAALVGGVADNRGQREPSAARSGRHARNGELDRNDVVTVANQPLDYRPAHVGAPAPATM